MRGKDALGIPESICFRITPAYAGKRIVAPGGSSPVTDHPRLCGEKGRWSVRMQLLVGSPPPMRGKAGFAYNIDAINRITPAYAGKSQVTQQYYMHEEDHPRLCGEKPSYTTVLYARRGSPPPMRGKGGVFARDPDALRITPAYAGKSTLLSLILSHH